MVVQGGRSPARGRTSGLAAGCDLVASCGRAASAAGSKVGDLDRDRELRGTPERSVSKSTNSDTCPRPTAAVTGHGRQAGRRARGALEVAWSVALSVGSCVERCAVHLTFCRPPEKEAPRWQRKRQGAVNSYVSHANAGANSNLRADALAKQPTDLRAASFGAAAESAGGSSSAPAGGDADLIRGPYCHSSSAHSRLYGESLKGTGMTVQNDCTALVSRPRPRPGGALRGRGRCGTAVFST
jgi:hypothetical protein